MTAHHHPTEAMPVPRHSYSQFAADCFKASQTFRQMANGYRKLGHEYLEGKNERIARDCYLEEREYWRKAWEHIELYRLHSGRMKP